MHRIIFLGYIYYFYTKFIEYVTIVHVRIMLRFASTIDFQSIRIIMIVFINQSLD